MNVNLTAHVHDNGDISLHIELDISNIAGTVNLGGINEPIIGQRKVTHDIRLREGEVNLIAGLTNTTDQTITGIPGLSSIPLLGYLFSGDSVDKERDEIMIAVVPHIIRQPTMTAENLRPKAVGNQTTVKLRYAPLPAGEPAAAPALRPQSRRGGARHGPGRWAAAALRKLRRQVRRKLCRPQLRRRARNCLRLRERPAAGRPALPPRPTWLPRRQLRCTSLRARSIQSSSGVFTVGTGGGSCGRFAVGADPGQFDPKILQLSSVEAGGLLAVDGQQPTISRNVRNESGSATWRFCGLRVHRASGPAAFFARCGSRPWGREKATIAVPSLVLRNSQGKVIGTYSPEATVNVQ